MLHSLLYSSAETAPLEEKEVRALLAKARSFNEKNGITGILLYYNHSFMQLLEGDKNKILDLFESKIFLDDRHCAVTKYYDKPIIERRFPEWSMGFKTVNADSLKNIKGYQHFIKDGFNSSELLSETTIAEQLLLMFVEHQTVSHT